MDMRKLVGRNVRRYRLAAGLTQEQLAETAGFSQQYVSDLERGKHNPSVVNLFHLAEALHISHVALVEPDTEALQAQEAPPRARGGPGSRTS